MNKKRKIIGASAVALGIVIAATAMLGARDYGPATLIRSAPIGTGYAAKMLCSGVFLSGRDEATIWAEDLQRMKKNGGRGRVNRNEKTAEAYGLGFLFKRTAVFTENCGCTLLIDTTEDEVRKRCGGPSPQPTSDPAGKPWPDGDAPSSTVATSNIDMGRIERTLDWAFAESDDATSPIRTRAVIVIYDGQIVAERYAKGITKDTRLLGWSMTKSLTSAMIGILVRQGKLDITKPAPVPEWRAAGDPRGDITLDQLLHMNSGLEFVEEYEKKPDSDAGFMFFTTHDMAKYAAMKPLINKPGEKFSYSSGTTMLLSRIIRETVGGSYTDYQAFVRRELFDKIGMRSAVIESDPSGTMVGAGFGYATARDWARFGTLYMNDGVWNGERILPEGWVTYTRTPAAPYAGYGAQFWLNADGPDGWLPNCPTDLFSLRGYEGQFVTIIPSRKTIIVRMGQTPNHKKTWDHDYFVSNILEALPK